MSTIIYPSLDDNTTIYISGFGTAINEKVIFEAFKPFGDIEEIFLVGGKIDSSCGFGFVKYKIAEDAESAIDNMHFSHISNYFIRCNIARPTRISISK